MEQFRNFGGRDGSQDHNQQRDTRKPGEKSDEDQEAADDLEGADEVSRELRHRESDASEPHHTHVRVDVLQDPLREENQSDS